MKKLNFSVAVVLIISIVAAISVYAITRSELGRYMQSKGIGSYYLDLIDEFSKQYDFTETQLDSIKDNAETIIYTIKSKNPSLLTSPEKLSGDFTDDEWKIIQDSFDNILQTANFYKTIERNGENDGDIVKVYDSIDDRLLMTIEVEDNPTYEETSSAPDETSEDTSSHISDKDTSSADPSEDSSTTAPSNGNSSYSSDVISRDDGPSEYDSSVEDETANPKTRDDHSTMFIALSIIVAASITMLITKKRSGELK